MQNTCFSPLIFSILFIANQPIIAKSDFICNAITMLEYHRFSEEQKNRKIISKLGKTKRHLCSNNSKHCHNSLKASRLENVLPKILKPNTIFRFWLIQECIVKKLHFKLCIRLYRIRVLELGCHSFDINVVHISYLVSLNLEPGNFFSSLHKSGVGLNKGELDKKWAIFTEDLQQKEAIFGPSRMLFVHTFL